MRGRAPFDAGAKDIDGLRGEDEVTVLEGPYTFRFSYYERKEGRERWVPRWTERDRLPELIRLEIRAWAPAAGRCSRSSSARTSTRSRLASRATPAHAR